MQRFDISGELIIHYQQSGAESSVRIRDFFNYNSGAISDRALAFVELSDGSILSAEQLAAMLPATGTVNRDSLYGSFIGDLLQGFEGSDRLSGLEGDDQLEGGLGNDFVTGGQGSDTYLFGRGHGTDQISNYASDYADTTDVLSLSGFDTDDVWFSRNQNDLNLQFLGSTDQVVIAGWFWGESQKLDEVVVGSSTIDMTGIEQLVSAMAAFGAPIGGVLNLTSEQQQQVGVQIAAAWA